MKGMLFSIALRNVLRHGSRTLITAIVMTVGIGMFIFFDSILAGMDRMTIDSMADYTESSLSVMTREYKKDIRALPLRLGFEEPELAAKNLLASLPHALAITPRTNFLGFASNRIDSLPVIGTVVNPGTDPTVFKISRGIAKGRWLSVSDAPKDGSTGNEIVIGKGLAADLGLGVGDWLVLSADTIYETRNADEFQIVGILDVPAPEVTKSGLFMEYGSAKNFLGDQLPVTELDIALPRNPALDADLKASVEAAAIVSATFPKLTSTPIAEAANDYLAMRNMKSKYSYMIILVVLLIAGVGIVNTILMSVYSRIKEIGVLRAYGMEKKQIKRLFSIEGVIIGFIGSLGGALLGSALVWWGSTAGIPLDAMMGKLDLGNMPLVGTLRGEWHPAMILFGAVFGIAASWVAARIPAKKASKIEVTDALRFV